MQILPIRVLRPAALAIALIFLVSIVHALPKKLTGVSLCAYGDPEVLALRDSARFALDKADSLSAAPVSVEKIPLLNGLVDACVEANYACQRKAVPLLLRAQTTQEEMKAAEEGDREFAGAKRLLADSSAALTERVSRRVDLIAKVRRGQDNLSRAEEDLRRRNKLSSDRAAEFRAKIEKANVLLEDLQVLEQPLKDQRRKLTQLAVLRETMNERRHRCRLELDALERAVVAIGQQAANAAQAAPAAKEKIYALSVEPLNESRSRAYQTIGPVFEAGRLLFGAGDVAGHRIEDFCRHFAQFAKPFEDFKEGWKSLDEPLAEIDSKLDQHERRLGDIEPL